jgi:hypothetical protein
MVDHIVSAQNYLYGNLGLSFRNEVGQTFLDSGLRTDVPATAGPVGSRRQRT